MVIYKHISIKFSHSSDFSMHAFIENLMDLSIRGLVRPKVRSLF